MTVAPDVLAVLVRRVREASPRLPGPGATQAWRRTKLVCVDGPAGSGKSTLATQLAVELDAQVVHMDDLYEGWEGGPGDGSRRLAERVLTPLAAGRAGEFRRYDWVDGDWAESHDVPPAPVLVVEGCGAAARSVDRWVALRVWVEADDRERLCRGLERDGEAQRGHWVRWMRDEAAHYAAEQTRARADVHLDGFGRLRGPAPVEEAS